MMSKNVVTYKKVAAEIEKLIKFLMECGLSDDENFPSTSQTAATRFTVTYPNSSFSPLLKNTPYEDLYTHQLEARAFHAKMLDGALIQMSYEFSAGKIEKYRLAFLPSPNLLEFQNNAEIYMEDVLYSEVIDKQVVTVPIRFDYDDREGVARSLKHPKSHLTLGQYHNCRIAVTAPVTPYFFVEFLLRSFYNTAANLFAADLPFHGYDLDSCITAEESALIHVAVPQQR